MRCWCVSSCRPNTDLSDDVIHTLMKRRLISVAIKPYVKEVTYFDSMSASAQLQRQGCLYIDINNANHRTTKQSVRRSMSMSATSSQCRYKPAPYLIFHPPPACFNHQVTHRHLMLTVTFITKYPVPIPLTCVAQVLLQVSRSRLQVIASHHSNH